jgi:diguanylate cyclase (GGDEF)-like protein
MGHPQHSPVITTPEQFIVEVGAELTPEVLQKRGRAVNALLRLAMLAGLEMEVDAAVNTFADFMSEIVPYDRILVFFWDEERELPAVRLARGLEGIDPGAYVDGNILNVWATRFSKPMLISTGDHASGDSSLAALQSGSALVIPINVGSRVMGSVQLFSRKPRRFSQDDAQLLWIFCLIAENQLSRGCAHEGLIKFAFTDYLTGLRTRGYFEQQLDLELKRAERKGSFLSLLMVDIDRFKLLNDQCGHHIGDQVLRRVASLLEQDMRDLDTLARYGGEEFVIILPDTDAHGALRVAQRMRQTVEQANFQSNTLRLIERITISIGIAVLGKDARFKRELIEFADAALYRAKHLGRNQVVTYSEPGVELQAQ